MRSISLLLVACLMQAQQPEAVSAHYYWQASPAGQSAQLLTLFCRNCQQAGGTAREVPLVSVLRDSLGDDQISYVWLLTYSRPSWEKRALSAVPFFYWKVGDSRTRVGNGDLKPLLNLTTPQRSVVSNTVRNVIQWTVLDPLSSPVRASSRAYQNNRQDHERLHLEEAESYLQSTVAADDESGLNGKELNTVIARLELRKSMLGDFVNLRSVSEMGESANLGLERTRARNWDLLRLCADKTGLLFEPIDLAGAKGEYAVLWYPVERTAPTEGPRLGPVWKLLDVKSPYSQRDRLLNQPHYQRTINGVSQEVVPVGVYSLMYPKMPLLMIDFSNEAHLRRHEMTQRAITELTSGVIGISRFTNWYYFIGADLYDFWAARRGTATNQQERLNCYSKFRVALALDQTVESNLRAAMQRRVNAIAVNPLETSPQNELRAAVQRYDLLRAAAADEDSPLQQRLTRDRRSELARFEATNAQQARAGIFHYASFGFYTRRAPEPDFLDRLEIYRQVDYDANLLDSLTSAGTSPEVAYDSQRIEKVIAELSALVPQVGSETVRLHAQRAIEKVNGLSADLELKTQCRAALDSIHPPALESASTR